MYSVVEGLEHVAWRVGDVQYLQEQDEAIAGFEVVRTASSVRGMERQQAAAF